MISLPILRASITILMNSSSLNPLQMIGVGWPLVTARTASSSGLLPGLQAEIERLAEVEDLLDDVPLLIDLDRVDAAVLAAVAVLLNRSLKGGVNLADAVAEDVGEPQEDRKLDAAGLELVDQFFQVDGRSCDLSG